MNDIYPYFNTPPTQMFTRLARLRMILVFIKIIHKTLFQILREQRDRTCGQNYSETVHAGTN